MNLFAFLWAIAGIIMILAEFFVPGLVIVFFGIGALITAVLTAIFPFIQENALWQLLIWLASSSLTIVGLRRIFKKAFKGKLIEASTDESFIGRTAKVVETITPELPGRIKFQGTTWKAIAYEASFQKGDTVEILKQEENSFVVSEPIAETLTDKS